MTLIKKWKIDAKQGKIFGVNGDEIGTYVNPSHGYCVASISAPGESIRFFKRSHLVWWAYHGEWPTQLIDHKDRVKTHDWIDNLVSSNQDLNASNNGRTYPGVSYCKRNKKYQAYIYKDNKKVHLGWYKTELEAVEARRKGLENK